MRFGPLLLFALLWTGTGEAESQSQAQPLLAGMDHIPVVVRDLEQAQADFKTLGFAIKPGRFHADGIRNAHVKFPDGSEIELITAPAATDALTSEYRARLETGEGPVYFGLYAPDPAALSARLAAAGFAVSQNSGLVEFAAASPLHPLFFGIRQKAPTDRPEHFAHANGALRLSGLWVRDLDGEKNLLSKLDVKLDTAKPCGPLRGPVTAAHLPEGNLLLVKPQTGTGNVAAAQVEVRSLDAVRQILTKQRIALREYPACDPASIWVPPSAAHGIWLQFVQVH
jgi:hypothetical protein